MRVKRKLWGRRWGLAWMAWALSACASVEHGRYGVDEIAFEGMDELDSRALRACLISRERETMSIRIGIRSPQCGRPPFDTSAPTLRLWRWPWTEWPAFNPAIFDQDLDRVLRWYRARGYYQARITEVGYDPPEARHPWFHGACDPRVEDCTVSLLVRIDEGLPTLVQSVDLVEAGELPAEVRQLMREELDIEVGAPVDEALYDRDRERVTERLRSLGYAAADVQGRIEVDTAQRTARVTYHVQPGPPFRFGRVSVSGQDHLPEHVIRAAAAFPSGKLYDPEVIEEMQVEVFALGAFSAVEIREVLVPEDARVDVEVVVTPLPTDALRLGVGVTSGAVRRTETADLVGIPQWDVHLFANYERRHVFGTLGRFSIDERPRLIFSRDFPRFARPQLGNALTANLNQPGLLEARTNTFQRVGWDYGPDPFLGFVRSDFFLRVGARRGFFGRRLVLTLAVQQDRFAVSDSPNNVTTDGSPLPASYDYTFVEQDVRLDLRDDRARATRGIFASFNTTQSPRWNLSDWSAFRVAPEVRTYVRLPVDVVWASRLAAAAFFVSRPQANLDELSQRLGPNTYRLRGGGAYSNRGFLAGTLGVGLLGGIRRWEASTELRVPLGENLVLAGFADFGDVNDEPSYRFSHLNTTLGYGLRYYTVVGAIRLDVGHRLARWQRLDGSPGIAESDSTLPFVGLPGAIHLTIGDPF